jgi:NADH-quinone oxidoreductase subunit N
MTPEDLPMIEPLLAVGITAAAVLIVDLFRVGKGKGFAFVLTLVGLVYALVRNFMLWDVAAADIFGGLLTLDRVGTGFNAVFLIAAIFSVMLSRTYMRRTGIVLAEYYVLLLSTVMGMMIMAQANDLIVLFLGLELLSIPLYVLAAFLRKRKQSVEAGVKYFLLGAFSSCFLVYGIALLYGATGSTLIASVVEAARSGAADPFLLKAGLGLFIAALGFKVAAVPFHMWAPDVYEGSPTPITAYMATAVKAAGFAALVRVFAGLSGVFGEETVTSLIALIALVTMIVGNLGALPQKNIKRMLAFSSIAHAGYILVGVAALTAAPGVQAAEGVLFYLIAYTFTNLGAFAVIIFLTGRKGEYNEISDFAGLAVRSPILALSMAVFMFTLTGIPPTAGFFGKFYLFKAAVDADLVWLAVAGVLMSVVSLYYYVRVVATMYLKPSEDEAPGMEQCPWLAAVSLVSVAGVLLLGIFPQTLLTALESIF